MLAKLEMQFSMNVAAWTLMVSKSALNTRRNGLLPLDVCHKQGWMTLGQGPVWNDTEYGGCGGCGGCGRCGSES